MSYSVFSLATQSHFAVSLGRKCVPANTHLEVQKRLKDLLRRHSEFRSVLMTSDLRSVPVGDLNFANVSIPIDLAKMPANLGFFDTVSLRFLKAEELSAH